MKKKLTIIIILIIGFIPIAKSQYLNQIPSQLSDSAQISVLTSAPWPEEAYAVFGHSAMRVNDPAHGVDYIFNYGVFDFDSPNFIYRFMAGETDYMVIAIDYKYYLAEYKERGVNISEQVINLTDNEKQKIWSYLINNIKSENRVYRYNIFYNNCTTKLVDIIEQNIEGEIIYPADDKQQSFRDLVHECVYLQPWLQFGIDLVIGADADKKITVKEKMFLPVYQMNTLSHSVIRNTDGTTKPLIIENNDLLAVNQSNTNESGNNFFVSPLFFGLILLLLSILVSLYAYRQRRAIASIFDFLLFALTGLCGSVILFMMLFSVHPCTSPNWNIVWLNPFQLLFALLFFVKACRKCIYYYHFINFAMLTVFLLAWCLIPQQLEIAFIPFILAIALRSLTNVVQYKKMNKKAAYSLPSRTK